MSDKKKDIESWAEYLSKKEDVLSFYKEAFCIDGEVEFIIGEIKHENCIKCTDSRRGVFYVATGKELKG